MTNLVEINGHCNESPLALTPVSEQGIRALFEGLAAVHDTLVFSAPAKAAIAITPSLFSLLVQYCGADPRFDRVMANTWPMGYRTMQDHHIRTDEEQFEVRSKTKQSIFSRLLGRS